jgi:hypothetical protein
MLTIDVKSEEPLTILKTRSGSSPGVDMSIHVIKLPQISHETVPLKIRARTEESPKSKEKKVAGIKKMVESYIEKMWVNF